MSVVLFTVTAVAAWHTGDIARLGEGAATAQLLLSRVLLSAVWVTAALVVIRSIQVFVWERLAARYLGVPVPRLIRDIVSCVVVFVACAGIVGVVFKQDITGLIATSGLIGLVIGFSLQTIILDVFTGLAIHVDRPFTIGHWIKMYGDLKGLHARVLEINWRTTRLELESNEMLIIPNSVLGKMVVSNFNEPDIPTRFQVELCLDASASVERCRRILSGAATTAEGVLEDPAPVVLLGDLTDQGLKYLVRYWIKPWHPLSPTTVMDKVLTSVVESLRWAGIESGYQKVVNVEPQIAASQWSRDLDLDRGRMLGRLALFRSLASSELDALVAAASTRVVGQNEVVIRQGDVDDSMYVLTEGLLNVYRATDGNAEALIARIRPGQYFGEMSLLTGEPRSATVRAAVDAIVMKIDKPVMTQLLTSRPALLDQLSRSLAEKRLADTARDSAPEIGVDDPVVSLAAQFKRRISGFFGLLFHVTPDSAPRDSDESTRIPPGDPA